MMANLFSVFNPQSVVVSLPLNWVSLFIIFLFLPKFLWVSESRSGLVMAEAISSLSGEFKSLLGRSNFFVCYIFTGLFFIILISNFMGLIPYVFTGTGHLSMTLSASLVLWGGYMSFGVVSNLSGLAMHLVPNGTPTALVSLMVLIESISSLIRPLTLSVRLAANMIAGHLLMTLMSANGPGLSVAGSLSLILAQVLLLSLETAVVFIQAYVFSVLNVLYLSESV